MGAIYFPSGKSILLTGAAGFIGSHLGNRLVDLGNKVKGLDNFYHASGQPLKFRCETGDVRNAEYLPILAKNCDVIVHLAAVINIDNSIEFPENVLDINTTGTLRALEVARRLDIPFVFASSSEVYGPTRATPSMPNLRMPPARSSETDCASPIRRPTAWMSTWSVSSTRSAPIR